MNNDVAENIIEVADQLFAKYGYKKTTLDDIARSLGKQKTAVYHYYKGKEEIFLKVVERKVQMLESALASSIDPDADPRENIKNYVMKRMEILSEVAGIYSAFREEYFEHFALIEQLRAELDARETVLIESMLKAGIEKGIFDIRNTVVTAHAFVTAMKGFEYKWALEDKKKVKEIIESMMDIFYNGIVKR